MASELEKMLVKLEADTAGLRRALRDAENGVAQYEQKTDRALHRVEARWKSGSSAIGGYVKAIAASYVSLAAAQATITAGADIARLSQQVGLTAERYQELRFAAERAGVAQATFDEAIKKFNENLSQLRHNQGGFRDWLRQAAPDMIPLLRNSRSLEEAFNIVANRVHTLSTAGERAELVAHSFGGRNDEIVVSLQNGAAAFQAVAARAREFGAVMSDETTRALSEAKKEIQLWETQAVVSFGNALSLARGYYVTLRSVASEWWDAELAADRRRREGGIGPTQEQTTVAVNRLADVAAAMRGLAAAADASATGWAATVTRATSLRVTPDYTFIDQVMRLERERAGLSNSTLETVRVNLEHEQEAFRRLVEERKLSETEAARLRVALHENAAAQIRQVYEEERQKVRETLQPYQDAFNSAIGGAIDSLIEGKRLQWKEFVASMLSDLAKVAARKALFEPISNAIFGGITTGIQTRQASSGLGDFVSLLSSAFPMRAGGGDVRASAPVIVGERRPEMFVPSVPGRVVPIERYAMSPTGGGAVYNIDARNAEIGVEERIMAVMAVAERNRPRPSATVAQDRRRFPTRRF